MMNTFFYPRSIAIIGASDNPGSLGKAVVKNLITMGFKGARHPVGRKPGKLYGTPIIPSVGDIPDKVDLAELNKRVSVSFFGSSQAAFADMKKVMEAQQGKPVTA